MSRIGKKPISIPAGVNANVDQGIFHAEGPKGKLSFSLTPTINVVIDGSEITVVTTSEDRFTRAMHGTTRSVISNMLIGVKDGYERKLELQGVGYVANISGNVLTLRVGLANELKKQIPEGIQAVCPDNTHIHVSGCDKQKVGQFAAEVRSLRKPEPYKGKGIRYVGEQVKIKAGKSAKG